ncbi:DEAD/DEAH box helicase [Microbacterium sp. MAHUQ-60]|uniref:DEAD/DEAH box helicase n=1 Tax=unclassified Microbacterium TaxID=2609290 RepID=UPI0036123844
MPKNGKPKGGRPSRNFEPRFAKKTSFHDRHAGARPAREERPEAGDRRAPSSDARSYDRRPGSVSPKHRGYRPAEAGTGAPKRRWNDSERAGRDEARGIRNRAESGRREAPHHRDDRRDDRGFGERRGSQSFSKGDRGARGGYQGAPRDDRPRRDDRAGGYERRDERPRFDRDDRGGRGGYNREERPRFNPDIRGGRGGYERNDGRTGADRTERRPFQSDDRPRRDDRPQRDDRPRRDDRVGGQGGYGRTERPRFDRTDRPRFDRDARTERPRQDRTERPARRERDDRPSRSDWNRTATVKTHDDHVDVVHERLEAKAVQATEVADVTFGDLGLGANIVEILKNLGAETPFPIQAATIPTILEGRDVLGRGRTGSGKTIAFGAPLVESVLSSQKGKRREFGRKPRAIILAPTRELALQIDRTVQPIARSVGLFTTQIYGGVPQGRQVGALMKGVDIVIGTPGRVEDLMNQRKLDLSEVRIAVLDEADHMTELGFVEPVQRILRATGTALDDRDASQKLLFSATLDREVASLVDEFLVEPAVYEVAGEDQESSRIEHRVLVIEHRDKAELLTSLVDRDGQTLVFARTRAYAEMLAEQFEDAGISAVSLHGDLNQAKRTRNLQKLTAGRVQVLVATDVAARGIHVDDIDLVVQADAPDEYKTYLHRAGRTGRAGRSGRVVTLIPRQRRRRMEDLLHRAEIEAPFESAQPGDDVIEEIAGRVPTAAELTA